MLAASAGAPSSDPRATRTVSIAAASNLVYALDAVNAAFTAHSPDTVVTVSTGASGNLIAQIQHGAPYDVLLSADVEYPRALIASGGADAASLTRFARGRLVLWSVNPNLTIEPIATAVRNPRLRKLAVANAHSAPYGRAAVETLHRLEVWNEAEPKLVVGENITQTAQFVETGNADAGFVALSLVLSPRLRTRGHWVLVPENLHSPIEQAAVLTRHGASNPAASEYLAFLGSGAAREIFQQFGYEPLR